MRLNWYVSSVLFGLLFGSANRAMADAISDIPDKILSQCGLVSGLLVAAVIWLAVQNAKTRAAWEADRAGMREIIEDFTQSYNNLAVSHAKQEGILLALKAQK